PRQPEVAVEPGVQPRAAVRLEPDDLPTGTAEIGMLLDAQVRAVGVTPDDPERGRRITCLLGTPGHQRTTAHDVVAARFARPGVDESAEVVGARGRVEVGRLVHMRCMLSTRAGAETSDPVIALLSLVSWSN